MAVDGWSLLWAVGPRPRSVEGLSYEWKSQMCRFSIIFFNNGARKAIILFQVGLFDVRGSMKSMKYLFHLWK